MYVNSVHKTQEGLEDATLNVDVCKPLGLEETSLSLGSSVHKGEEQGLCV